MFHIITCLANDQHDFIVKILKEFLAVTEEMDAALTSFTSPVRMLKHLEDVHDGENYLVLVGDFVDSQHTLKLLSAVRTTLRGCYIIFLSHNARLLHQAVNQNTRLSGFVVSPLLDNTLLHLMKRIYADSQSENDENDDRVLPLYTLVGEGDNRERVLIRIPFADIYFIEAANRKTRYVLQAVSYSDNTALSKREPLLDKRFIRCHNAFIINAEKISYINYGKSELGLKNGDVIPISRGKKPALKQLLLELRLSVTTYQLPNANQEEYDYVQRM